VAKFTTLSRPADSATIGETADEHDVLDDDADSDEEYDPWLNPRYETDTEILNNPTDENLAGYSWVTNGCEFLGPNRFRSLE
jgi:hypothetical protein